MQHPITNHSRSVLRRRKFASLGVPLGLVALISASLIAILAPSVRGETAGYSFKAVTYLGSPAPGGGAFVNDFEPTRLSNRGQIAFTAEPDVPGEEGIFLAGGGTSQQIMRFGQPAPGGGTFSTFELGNIGLNDFGDAAFAFTLEPLNFGPPIFGGVYRWSHVTQTLSPVVVPNLTPDPKGGFFVGVHFNVSLNEFGWIVFAGFVTNTPVGLSYGLFVQDHLGHTRSVVRPGDPSPDGGTFLSAGNPAVINDLGDVVFEGQTTVDPTPDFHKLYIKSLATGRLRLIPQPAGVINEASLWINDFGQVVFGGTFSPVFGSGNGAVYLRSGPTTTVLAKVGDPAPGGGTFSFITGVSIQGQIGLNNLGNVAFEAATDTGDEAMYLYNGATKTLRRLAGIGTVIPGVGTIVSLEQGGALIFPPPPTSGFPLSNVGMNDLDQIAFAATVVNGTVTRGVLLLGTPTFFDK